MFQYPEVVWLPKDEVVSKAVVDDLVHALGRKHQTHVVQTDVNLGNGDHDM